MRNLLTIFAAMSGLFCVGFGAFASHALSAVLSPQHLEWIEKGWRYQAFHTAVLLVIGIALKLPLSTMSKKLFQLAGYFWIAGIIAFSFGLYTMAIVDNTDFIGIIPVGGVAFLIGWLLVFVALLRDTPKGL